ncbi:bile acid:sodium symporter family protein [Nitrincola tapanii]|uniref:Bile acid:sodium symporter family protein n=1 Tax=Nitrincola tapanii TaxID=1708751 RepID=A0A5A9W5T0_9GAMM|nr:bile acid:sodium symporter [Nitrincola tapanii]KAA0875804.1 bile acid:sodium symporter family protein [Nitrincola tapanii]
MSSALIGQVFLPLSLFIIMFSVGIALKLDDFKQVFRQPLPIGLGLVLQLLLLPLLGWLVVWLFALPPVLALGLLILTLAPGGATSNAISLLARGDAALSVSLTAITSLITPFSIPLITAWWLSLWLGQSEALVFPVMQAILQMLLIALLPVVLGVLMHQRWPGFSQRLQAPMRRLAFLLMLSTVLLLVWTQRVRLETLLAEMFWPVVLLVLLAMLCGYGMARLVGLNDGQQITLLIETGLQNAGTALVVTGTLLQNPQMSAVVLLYGVLMQVPALLLIGWRNRQGLRSLYVWAAR